MAFWVVGETVALGLLVFMLASAVSAALGNPRLFAGRVPTTDGSVSLFVPFLLAWTTLWTVGGFAAGTHLFRQLFGEDYLEIEADGLQCVWRAGPFRRRVRIPRESMRRVRLRAPDKAVVIDSDAGTQLVADLGTHDERALVCRWLTDRLTIDRSERVLRLERQIPPRDRDVRTHGSSTVIVYPTHRVHAIRAGIAWGLVAITALGWVDALRRGGISAATTGETAAAALTMVFGIAAVWVTWMRTEWIVSAGQLRLRRRFGPTVLREELFADPASLEIERWSDSDGDDRFTLIVREDKRRRVLSTALYDQYELTALAEWLAARTGFAFKRTVPP